MVVEVAAAAGPAVVEVPPVVVPPEIGNEAELYEKASALKEKLHEKLLILGHHYQRHEVIQFADFRGDSLKLAQIGRREKDKPHVIFCGVHFMAETADILSESNQEICLPDLAAGCDMADMASYADVSRAFRELESAGLGDFVPITYVNSSAKLKSLVGKKGGAVCTSSNAKQVIQWALAKGKHVFFFPDQHLGRNVSKSMGFSAEKDMLLWKPDEVFGGHSEEKLSRTKIWLWQGHCPVHALFSVHQIKKLRAQDPSVQIYVHPECAEDVVDLADGWGSTEWLIKKVAESPAGSHLAIGTEVHLVERMAMENPTKKIESLNSFTCQCGTMSRITLPQLVKSMEKLDQEEHLPNIIRVDGETKKFARIALENMFAVTI